MKVKLSELYEIGSSKRVFQSEWREKGIPFYRAREIAKLSADGYVDNELFIDRELYLEYINKYGKPEPGDIMITGVGTLGVCYVVKPGDKFYFKDGNILWFKQKAPDKILPEYLVKAFESKEVKEFINKNSSGTTVGTFTIQTAKKLEISLPTIEEQRAIINKVSKIENIIKQRRLELQLLDNLTKSRFVEMFGDPSSNDKGYPEKLLPEIAEYWNGLTYKPEDVSDEGTIVLRSSNIQNAALDFVDTVRVVCNIGEKKYVQDNDILMCSRNGSARLVGKVALIKNIEEPMSFGAFMMIIRSIYYPYLMTYFQLPAFRAQITTGATTTINQITGRMLDVVKLPVPDLDTVNEFADFVKQVDKLKFEVQKSLEETQILMNSLMQQYFG